MKKYVFTSMQNQPNNANGKIFKRKLTPRPVK